METIFMVAFFGVCLALIIAALKGFDRVAGRGPKQVRDGMKDANLCNFSIAEEIEKLEELRKSGTITEKEFQNLKYKTINR